MRSPVSTALRAATVVLTVVILVVAGLLIRFLIVGTGDSAPRTELQRAVVAAEEAVKANPESAAARVKLGAAYLESNAINAAREQAVIAIRLAPAEPEGYYIMGLIESRAGNEQAALGQLEKAADTKGQLAGFYLDVWRTTAAVHERSGDTSRAIEAMNKAVDLGPENAELLVARARLYEQERRWADALYDYSLAAQFVPDYKESLEGARRIAKEHPEAVAEMKKIFESSSPASVTETKTTQ